METKSELEELIDHLGSGIPRILEAYPPECFKFTEIFICVTFFNDWDLSEGEQASCHVTEQVGDNVQRIVFIRNGGARAQ